MDLYDRIESTRFLGREMLTWVWWRSELFEGSMTLGDHGEAEVWLDDTLILESQGEEVEQSRMKGGSPSATPEAKEALRQGKVPTKARISVALGERDFSFVLEGESFALSGVRLPALLQDEREERFYERMFLLEELDDIVATIYREFLALRTDEVWTGAIAPAIRAWVRDEPVMTREEYVALLEKVGA